MTFYQHFIAYTVIFMSFMTYQLNQYFAAFMDLYSSKFLLLWLLGHKSYEIFTIMTIKALNFCEAIK